MMIRTEGKFKEIKSLGKVAALKKQHKKDTKEMTELATVIAGSRQAPPQSLSMQQHMLLCVST